MIKVAWPSIQTRSSWEPYRITLKRRSNLVKFVLNAFHELDGVDMCTHLCALISMAACLWDSKKVYRECLIVTIRAHLSTGVMCDEDDDVG